MVDTVQMVQAYEGPTPGAGGIVRLPMSVKRVALASLLSAITERRKEDTMNYAWIENGTVTNIIWLYEGNAHEFPNAVKLNDVPAQIGDTYLDGVFYRDRVPVLTALEQANATIAALDAAVVDLTYQNILLELGVV